MGARGAQRDGGGAADAFRGPRDEDDLVFEKSGHAAHSLVMARRSAGHPGETAISGREKCRRHERKKLGPVNWMACTRPSGWRAMTGYQATFDSSDNCRV
jgi:hypothetical protein